MIFRQFHQLRLASAEVADMPIIVRHDHHHHHHHSIEARCEVMRRLDALADQIDLVKENIMIDTTKILAAATRATTDSAALRALVKDVKTSLDKSIADLAAAIAASDPVAMAKAQADIDSATALLDTDSTETEAALSANVTPAP
jgi:hypothetical protein